MILRRRWSQIDCRNYDTVSAEVDNDWSRRTSGFYGRYFQKAAQKDYRVSSGVLLKYRWVYTLEMRHRRCRASSAEGARIEAPKAPRGGGVLGEGCPPPQPTRRSGGASWAPPAGSGAEPRPPTHSRPISAPQKPSGRRLLKFWGPEICLVETRIL